MALAPQPGQLISVNGGRHSVPWLTPDNGSQRGFLHSSISFTWEPIRNASSWAPPAEPGAVRWDPGICVITCLQLFWCSCRHESCGVTDRAPDGLPVGPLLLWEPGDAGWGLWAIEDTPLESGAWSAGSFSICTDVHSPTPTLQGKSFPCSATSVIRT